VRHDVVKWMVGRALLIVLCGCRLRSVRVGEWKVRVLQLKGGTSNPLPYFGSDTNACAGGRDTTLWLMKVVTKFLGADERISARRIVGGLVL
jgi:hypothetical protein